MHLGNTKSEFIWQQRPPCFRWSETGFYWITETFPQYFGNSISRPSSVTSLPCQLVKNERPGRPIDKYSTRGTRTFKRASFQLGKDCEGFQSLSLDNNAPSPLISLFQWQSIFTLSKIRCGSMEWWIQAIHPQIATLMMTHKTYHFMVKILKDEHPLRKVTIMSKCLLLNYVSNDELTAYLCNTTDPIRESFSHLNSWIFFLFSKIEIRGLSWSSSFSFSFSVLFIFCH